VLQRVVEARSNCSRRKDHEDIVPYKESKLTRVLKEVFSGDGVMVMLCCMSGHPEHYRATKSTMLFALACRSLSAHPVVKPMLGGGAMNKAMRTLIEKLDSSQAENRLLKHQVTENLRASIGVSSSLAGGQGGGQGGGSGGYDTPNLAIDFRNKVEEALVNSGSVVRAYIQDSRSSEDNQELALLIITNATRVLKSSVAAEQMNADLLFRMYKDLMMVNYTFSTRSGNALLPELKRMFKLLRSRMSAKCWGDLLPYALAQLVTDLCLERAEADRPLLPAYVVSNMTEALAAVWDHLSDDDDLNSPTLRDMLPAGPALRDMASYLTRLMTYARTSRPLPPSAHKTMTILNMLSLKILELNPEVSVNRPPGGVHRRPEM
jgi:hypothetical protein